MRDKKGKEISWVIEYSKDTVLLTNKEDVKASTDMGHNGPNVEPGTELPLPTATGHTRRPSPKNKYRSWIVSDSDSSVHYYSRTQACCYR